MNGTTWIRRSMALVPLVLAGGLAAQLPEAGEESLPPSDVTLPVSIQALMVSMIDPAAHYLWDFSAREEALSDDQWQAVAHAATQLAAASPLIRVAGTGEDDSEWTSDRSWILFAQEMQQAAVSALDAVNSRDETALAEASNRLVDSCDRCHQAFRPTLDPERGHEIPPGGLYQTL